MQTMRRELLYLVLIGLCSLTAVRAGAQVEGADGDSGGAIRHPTPDKAGHARSSGGVAGGSVTLDLHQATIKDALRAVAKQARVRLLYNDSDIPADRLVTIAISDATIEQALAMVLRGTKLRARPTDGGIAIESRGQLERSERHTLQGSLSGRVTDATTGRPIGAVTVQLEEASLATSTDSEGQYRFPTVPVGTYTVTARRVGYERVTKSVIVVEGTEGRGDLAMTPAPTILDQVVTTGTVIPTSVKASPTPVSVVTSDQIEQQRALTMMSIIRQAVPTAVAHDAPNVPANSNISVRGASSLNGAGDMKIFVDGVEASSFGTTPVDPASIDRIEVIRGPQAATLYGADAASGVIQVFTKRGDTSLTRPQVNARLATGLAQTPYVDFERVLRQQYSGSVSGGAQDVSYRFGGGYKRLADYAPRNGPDAQSASSVYGGMKFTRGILVADLSGRYYRNTIPTVFNPQLFSLGYLPYARPFYLRGDFTNETYGLRTIVSPAKWWRNQFTLGIDRFGLRNTQTQPRRTTPADTLLFLQSRISRKLSMGYNGTASTRIGRFMNGSLTLGLDHYIQAVSQVSASRALNTSGTITTVPPGGFNVSDNSITNTGYFAQAQVALHDAIFLTLGIRAEDNSTFGTDYGLATLPRAGLSFVQPVGAATLKLRASYGKSLRTPGPTQAAGRVNPSSIQLANPELAPERQQGWDGGVDLIFGNKGSLGITGFDQTAIDLIALVQVASTPVRTAQYRNIGRVSNRGLEVEGTFTPVPWLAVRAQYGYVRSRIKEVGAAGGQVEVGDSPVDVPANTAGVALTVTTREGTTLNGGLTYYGKFRAMDWLATYRCLAASSAPECPESYLNTFSFRSFIVDYPGFAKFNLNATHRFNSTLEVFLAIDNLTNNQAFEFDNSSPVIGRTTMLGLEITY
jgi:outer membrane receptor protein involved in Fe transport